MSLLTWLTVLAVTFAVYRRLASTQSLPADVKELPGPKGYPVLGNLLDVPKKQAYVGFKKLGDVHGPIFKLDIFGQCHVIICQQGIADDLLSRKGRLYSDRGNLHMVKLVTGGRDLLANGQNDYWRRGRKLADAMMTSTMASQWEPWQTQEAKRMVIDMVKAPERYGYWFERFSTSVSLREIFGTIPRNSDEDEYHTKRILTRMHHLERVATPGAYLVELMPILMYLPDFLAPFKREAKVLHEEESSYFRDLLIGASDRYNNGDTESAPSFARCWLEKEDHWELSFDEVKYVFGTLYGGGAGTTAGAMQSFVQAMLHYPEWQANLQKEVDTVVGPDRIPTFVDAPKLPVLRAIMKELLRWRPVVPGNLPHRLTEDDVYEGYHIPEGALIHGVQWAIHRGEELYPDGETFNPKRWLDPKYPTFKEPLEQQPNLKRFSAFGYGRRICPGLETAERSFFIQVAYLAWACHISKKVDNAGKEVSVPWYDYTEGSNVAPKPFLFDLKARSQQRIDIMQQSWANGVQ